MIETDIVVGSGMKLTCSRDELAESLAVVARAVSTRSAVQVLQGLLLRAAGGRLELAATDMELSLRASVDADVDEEGAAVVPGRLLVDIARLLPPGQVALEHRSEEGAVRLDCGSAGYRLHTYSVEDFPRLPDTTAAETFSVDRPALLETIAQVSRSASRDESRPVLTGVLVRFEGTRLVMAATDSYRLSLKETEIEGAAPDLDAIIPARALGELARIAQGGADIAVGVHDNQIVFESGGVVLTTRRIDGQFPNYKQLIPETFEHEVTVPRAELLDVVRRTAVMAQRNSPLRLRFAEGELTVSTRTQDVGEARETLPVAFTGDPLEIGFNADFLRDGIEAARADEVTLRLISPLRPAVIAGDADDPIYLIMPIRLPD